jgi:hypothetical protein
MDALRRADWSEVPAGAGALIKALCVPALERKRTAAVCPFSRCREKGHTLRADGQLLVGDGGPGCLEGVASLVRSLLVDLLQNGLGRGLDQVLGLLESKAGE